MTQKSSTSDTQAQRGLRELRGQIIAGKLPAGTKLREVPLASEFGISRTPLRSALLRLEQEGLIERVGGGYTVRSFSYNDALLAIELRGVIEGTALRLAAERGVSAEDIEPVKETLQQIDDLMVVDPFEGYGELNELFHEQLVELTGSHMMQRETSRASRLPFAAPSAFSSTAADVERFQASLRIGQQHHHAMIDAIERRQGARAEALAREHAKLAQTNIETAYRERSELNIPVPQLALVVSVD